MSNDEMKRLAEVVRAIVKEENKPIIEKLDATVAGLDASNKRLDKTNQRLDRAVADLDANNKRLDKTNEKLDAAIEKLDATFDQVGDLTVKVDAVIIPELKKHSKILQKLEAQSDKNAEDIKKLDKRLAVTEANQGIQPPIEHQLI